MKVSDLIAELHRFDGDQHVAVEVDATTGKYFGSDDVSVLLAVDSVQFENCDRFGVKIILEP